jgi:serine/threonine protein kinase
MYDDRYELIEVIGEGGMSQVWKARDSLLDMVCALKIYLSHLDSIHAKEAIRKEFEILRELTHRNIIRHDHFGIDRKWSRPFIVTKIYPRGSAASIINRSGTAIDEMVIACFLYDASSALDYLHNQAPAIVHQDVKPDNFLIDEDGSYVLTDFGISIRKRETREMPSDKDSHGKWAGDQAYVAPERFGGEMARQPQDIFSLGVALFEIATGQLPFGEMGGLLLRGQTPIPPHIDDCFEYSHQLKTIIYSCLAASPSDRPTARELFEKAAFYRQHEYWPTSQVGSPVVIPPRPPWIDRVSELIGSAGYALSTLWQTYRLHMFRGAAIILLIAFFYAIYQQFPIHIVHDPAPIGVVDTDPIENPERDTMSGIGDETTTDVPVVNVIMSDQPIAQSTKKDISPQEIVPVASSDVKRKEAVAAENQGEKVVTDDVKRTIEPKGAEKKSVEPSAVRVLEDPSVEKKPTPYVDVKIQTPKIEEKSENTAPNILFNKQDLYAYKTRPEYNIPIDAEDVEGHMMTYQWEQVSGSDVLQFNRSNVKNPVITNIQKVKAGVYGLKLTVVDEKGAVSTQVIQLTIRVR